MAIPRRARVAKLRDAGYPAPLYQYCDLRDVAALQAAIAEATRQLGPITVLVNNAANDQRHKWEDVTPEYWDERMATNLRHQFFAIQAIAPIMRAAGGGSIINFGSASWHNMQGGMPAYTTAKAGVEGLTRGMARDLGGVAIRVNTVIPGWIMTQRQIELRTQNILATQKAESARLFVGSPATVMAKLQPMIAESLADELMIITAVYDHEARKKSYSLLADAFGLGKKEAA